MSAVKTESPAITLTLNGEEREMLLTFLKQKFHDKQIEEHRTDAFEFRAHVQREAALLQGLIDKLR